MRRVLLAAIALLGLAAAARAEEVRGVTDTEIVIGTYTDLSGVTAVWGVPNSNAIRMAFDEQNAKGGIHGRKIRYIVEDNQYQVPRSIQAANKLLNRDNVFLLLANDGTPMNNAVLPMQLEKNVPNMFPLTAARSMYEPFNRLKFGQFASYYDQMRAGVKYMVEQEHKKTLCAMYVDSDFGRDVMAGVYEQTKAMGLTLAAETTHKPTDTDFAASVARIRDANCGVVLLGTLTRDTNLIVAAIRKTGWNVPLLGQSAITDQAVAEVPGNATEGLRAMIPSLYAYPDDKRPAVQAFVKNYRDRYGKDPTYPAEVGYAAAQAVLAGLDKAGPVLTVDSFIKGMESLKDYRDIFGSPPMTFGPEQRHGTTQSYMIVVHDGKWVPVTGQPIGY